MTRSIAILFLTVMVVFGAQHLAAQTTEFTYQGNLVFNGQPATGSYDFEFSLFNAFSGGTQIGQTLAVTNVAVNDGVFTVSLNFGNVFPGSSRFLQINVRPAGNGAFTPLAPRQPISSAPYSIKSQSSETAVNATQLGGVAANQYVVTTDPRMTDARPPTSGSTAYIQNTTTTQQSSNFVISGSGRANSFDAGRYELGGIRFLWTLNDGTYVGKNAGGLGPSGGANTFVGMSSGSNTTTGSFNTFVGHFSGLLNSGGQRNSFFGLFAGYNTTSGFNNSYFGAEAGRHTTGTENTENAIFGAFAGYGQNAGSRNSYFGTRAGGSLFADGSDNAFFGWEAGQASAGSANAFFGRSAGAAAGSGSSNSFFGNYAGGANTSGQDNVFMGAFSGIANNTGSRNIFIGKDAGTLNTSGQDNTVIGTGAGVTSANLQYATAIGADSAVSTSNTIKLGRVQETVIAPNRVIVGDQTTARGELSIYANSGNADLYLQGPSTTTGINIAASNDPTPTFFISHYNGTTYTDRLIITPTGTVRIPTLGSAGGTSLCRNASLDIATCSSSARYKTNIADFRSGIDVIRRLRPVTFNWTAGNALDLGLVAEEVAGIDPLLVTYNDKGEVEGVKYDRIGVVLINTVKEQQEKIEKLEAELRDLRQLIIAVSKPEKKEENK